jgi:hypothetical protein
VVGLFPVFSLGPRASLAIGLYLLPRLCETFPSFWWKATGDAIQSSFKAALFMLYNGQPTSGLTVLVVQ